MQHSRGIRVSENGNHHGHSRSRERTRSITFYVLLGAGAFVFIRAFPILSPIILSLLLTFFVSFAINPLVMRLRKFVGGRKIATLCVAAALLLALGGAVIAFLGPMRSSISTLSEQLPEYWARLRKPFIKIEQRAAVTEAKLQAEVAVETANTNAAASSTNSFATNTSAIAQSPAPPAKKVEKPKPATTAAVPSAINEKSANNMSSLGQTLQGLAQHVSGVAVNAVQIVLVMVTVFFGVLFTLMNPRGVFRAIFGMVPERHHPQALKIVKRIGAFLPTWALATLVAMCTVGFLVFLLMWPLLGFPTALVLGIIAGTFEAIPYLGPTLSAVPAVLLALSKGGLTPVWVCLMYLGVQLLENNLIIPQIMARGMKLHSVAVIFSILVCAAAFGVLGVLVAAPLVAVIQILHEEIYRKRFLPTVTDNDLDDMARSALGDRQLETK